jgi:ribosomal protein S18 acetylase RimI-like enzyme
MFSTRDLTIDDQTLLWEFLHVALWDPPPAPLRPRAVLDDPQVRIYAEDWGRAGDVGVVGELAGEPEPVGACWMRLMDGEQGLAYIDEQTPQLGMALFPAFQRRGFGTILMQTALTAARESGYRQVSLTVHPENPAIKLYLRCGFTKRALRRNYHLMVVDL